MNKMMMIRNGSCKLEKSTTTINKSINEQVYQEDKNKMDIEIASHMYNQVVPVDNNFDLELD